MARKPARRPPAEAAAAAAAPHRLPDRARRRAADVSDRLPRLVVRRLRRRQGRAADPARYDPENIFGRNIFGFGLLLFIAFTTLVGALAKNLIGRQILQFGETIARAHADRAADLQRAEADRRDDVHPHRHHLPAGLPDRVPAQGRLAVAFMSHAASTARSPSETGEADLVSVFLPMTPNPTTGFLRFVPRERDRAARHEPRGRDEAHHLRRPRHRAGDPAARAQAAAEPVADRPLASAAARAASMDADAPSPDRHVRRLQVGRREGGARHEDRGTRRGRLLRLADGAAPLATRATRSISSTTSRAAGSTPSSACSR